MAKAPIAFLAVFVFSLVAAWLLTWQAVVPEKNEQVNTKQGIIDRKQSDIDSLSKQLEAANRENDKLRNVNAQYQSAHDEKNFPLKKRGQILAKQLSEFVDELDKDRTNAINNLNWRELRNDEWQNRFAPRINVMTKQLDELGQHSDKIQKLDIAYYPNFGDPSSDLQLRELAAELNKLAAGLPDTTSE